MMGQGATWCHTRDVACSSYQAQEKEAEKCEPADSSSGLRARSLTSSTAASVSQQSDGSWGSSLREMGRKGCAKEASRPRTPSPGPSEGDVLTFHYEIRQRSRDLQPLSTLEGRSESFRRWRCLKA
mmetsp:Transcript_39139/g.72956  ORF Transcript_39139/g.72956 Transcript_39139/m.72956 type:complete len:126 (-) Transcript_39139:420-797(-)